MHIFQYFVFILNLLLMVESLRPNNRRQLCETPTLKHGQVRIQRGKFARYTCFHGYQLYGDTYSSCVNNRWDIQVPTCIRPGCPSLEEPPNGMLLQQNNGASSHVYCTSGFELAGSGIALCDGMEWDRALGNCRETQLSTETSCDFETENLCGWKSDPTHDFEWKRRNGVATTKQLKTGPKHDHTTMEALSGHYMVAEAVGMFSKSAARLISPVYEPEQSINSCIRFYYHMYGKSGGQLRVYIKPRPLAIATMLANSRYVLFDRNETDDNIWKEALIRLPPVVGRFQIVFEAISSYTALNDIAIDDFALLDSSNCADDIEQTTMLPTDEVGGVFDIQTCVGRCQEERSDTGASYEETIHSGKGSGGVLLHCDCYDGCEDQNSCCPDYRSTCIFDLYSTMAISTNEAAVIATESIKQVVVTTPDLSTNSINDWSTIPEEPSTSKQTTHETTSKTTLKSTVNLTSKPNSITASPTIIKITSPTTIQVIMKATIPAFIPINTTATIPTTTSTTLPITIPTTKLRKPAAAIVRTTVKKFISLITTLSSTAVPIKTTSTQIRTKLTTPTLRTTTSKDNVNHTTATPVVSAFGHQTSTKHSSAVNTVNELQNVDKPTEKMSSNTLAIIGSLILLGLCISVVCALYRRYSRYPGVYKNYSQRCSEFSEVRFLTGDEGEVVDF